MFSNIKEAVKRFFKIDSLSKIKKYSDNLSIIKANYDEIFEKFNSQEMIDYNDEEYYFTLIAHNRDIEENNKKLLNKEIDNYIQLIKKYKYEDSLIFNLEKLRKDMPQVNSSDIDEFINSLDENIYYELCTVKIKDILPSQKEFNTEKINENIRDILLNDYKDEIFIISSDNFLVDGHHRWAAKYQINPEAEQLCYKIHLPIELLLQKVNESNLSHNVNINDKKIQKALIITAIAYINGDITKEQLDIIKAKKPFDKTGKVLKTITVVSDGKPFQTKRWVKIDEQKEIKNKKSNQQEENNIKEKQENKPVLDYKEILFNEIQEGRNKGYEMFNTVIAENVEEFKRYYFNKGDNTLTKFGENFSPTKFLDSCKSIIKSAINEADLKYKDEFVYDLKFEDDRFSIEVSDSMGQGIVDISRVFYYDYTNVYGEKRKTVEHSSFRIYNEKLRNGTLSNKLLLEFEKLYDEIGIENIILKTGYESGKLVWPMKGFLSEEDNDIMQHKYNNALNQDSYGVVKRNFLYKNKDCKFNWSEGNLTVEYPDEKIEFAQDEKIGVISNIKEEIFGGKKIGRLNYEQQIKDQALMLINDIDNNSPTKEEDFETLKQLYVERVDVVDKENLEYNKIKQYFQNKNICYTKITNHVVNDIMYEINVYDKLTDENKKEEKLKDLNYTFKEHFQTVDKNKQYSAEFIRDCYRKYNDYFPAQDLVYRFASVWDIRTQSGKDSVYDVLKSESRVLRIDEIDELKRLISKQKKNKSFDASEMFLKLNNASKVLHLNLQNGLNYYIDRTDKKLLSKYHANLKIKK